MKTPNFIDMSRMFILVTLTGSVSCVRADWGSVRGNNRSHDFRHDDHRGPGRRKEVVVVRPEHHVDHDLDIDRHHSHYWSSYWSGMRLRALPHGYLSIRIGGRPYYYYEGVYYEPAPEGYSVVAPPVGATISSLPAGATGISINGTIYFYAGGAFYLQQPNGFAVVPAPIGVTVAELPPGATPVVINGNTYYLGNGTYYFPVMQGGVTVYTTVKP
jgi:hypothetical protein